MEKKKRIDTTYKDYSPPLRVLSSSRARIEQKPPGESYRLRATFINKDYRCASGRPIRASMLYWPPRSSFVFSSPERCIV